MSVGQRWPECTDPVRDFVNDVRQFLIRCLGPRLDAIYLHGSLAMGCFYPPKSDIDLLAVVKDQIDAADCLAIHQGLLAINDQRPITGALELSIVTSATASNPVHPAPYELHFGENLEPAIRDGSYDYQPASSRVDPDLTAHFMVVKHRGIALYGEPAAATIGNLNWQSYQDSVLADLDWILDRKNILDNPYYGVLNACRVLEMFKLGEGTVSSKEEGALWALLNVPAHYHPIILEALCCYRSADPVSVKNRKTGGRKWDPVKLLDFRDYVSHQRSNEAGF